MKLATLTRFACRLMLIAGLCLSAPSFATDKGAATAEDIKQETAELLEALRSYGAEQRDEALERSQSALQNLDRRIEALESSMLEQWDQMDQAAREKSRASLQALREQRTRVAEWYGSLKSGSAEAWGHIKQGFSSAYEALNQAWENSEAELGANSEK
jgi:hypothetical protein